MDNQKETSPDTETNNIFRRHFFQYCLCAISAIILFRIAYAVGWYETGVIILLAPACSINSYLFSIRAERNADEKKAVIHIGILGIFLLIGSVWTLLSYPIEEALKESFATNTWLHIFLISIKMLLLQVICHIIGIFPSSPRD